VRDISDTRRKVMLKNNNIKNNKNRKKNTKHGIGVNAWTDI